MNFVGLDPIKALIYSAVFNGVVAPVVRQLGPQSVHGAVEGETLVDLFDELSKVLLEGELEDG